MAIRDKFDFSALSSDEKCILAHELLFEIEDEAKNTPLTPEQVAELDRRLAAYERGELEMRSWEEVRARLKLDE